eukprot:TRINITY_DN3124_c0_g1_i1.p1 TRINITY_DN3124_c0_g1~~TRINITY_DN3124_c0_g1_i1.p1  ORF type:complete len:606 (-),score=68.19 TRINITY_DN3124_c0_g1_i1:25-1842(-)
MTKFALRYVFSTIFLIEAATPDRVLGACSCILWSLFLIPTLKYIIFVFRADHHGEGGTFPLRSLILSASPMSRGGRILVTLMAITSAGFLLGDGAFTPAVSVISAVEGLTVANLPVSYVLPIAIVILLILFLAQFIGVSKIGFTFGPIMLLWFFTIGALGIYHICSDPSVFRAFSPHYAILYIVGNGFRGYLTLSAVFLCMTGVEAMYADIGQLTKGSVTVSWLVIVYPSLVLQYLGQTAVFMTKPDLIGIPFFNIVPTPLFWPVMILATLATVIASQAMISGTFSVVSQAIGQNLFPRLRMKHTSKHTYGEIYIPSINVILCIITLALMIAFQSSARLVGAYGLGVNIVLVLTTILFSIYMRRGWHLNWIFVFSFAGFFLFIELAFLITNFSKVPEGAWVALVIGFAWTLIMLIWYYGSHIQSQEVKRMNDKNDFSLAKENENSRLTPSEDIEMGKALVHFPGTGAFVSSLNGPPVAFNYFTKATGACPANVIQLTVKIFPVPVVPELDRIRVTTMDPSFMHVHLKFGYFEKLDIIGALKEVVDLENATIYISREDVIVTHKRNFLIRPFLYIYETMNRNSAHAIEDYKVPSQNILELGVCVAL